MVGMVISEIVRYVDDGNDGSFLIIIIFNVHCILHVYIIWCILATIIIFSMHHTNLPNVQKNALHFLETIPFASVAPISMCCHVILLEVFIILSNLPCHCFEVHLDIRPNFAKFVYNLHLIFVIGNSALPQPNMCLQKNSNIYVTYVTSNFVMR